MTLRQSLLALAVLITAAAANAANQDMTNYTGNYSVKDCNYTENYVNYPKDYNCRFTEIRVTAQANNVYEISYTDELGQKVDDIAMSDFTQKDQTQTTQGAFAYSESNVTWTYTRSLASGAAYTDTRTFTLNNDGTITYDHAITSSTGDNYKSADWNYSLTKEK